MDQPVFRVLGIAPYEGMQFEMQRVAEEYPNIQLEVYTGDMEEGVRLAQEHGDENFDVIISRGGTAEMIRSAMEIPVAPVRLSVYDILRAIKMAENYTKLYAIVGFPDITEPAHILCDLLRKDLDIITIHSASEVDTTLERLKLGDYRMVIGDMITRTVAREKGLDALLVTSGLESLHDAFDQALALAAQFHSLQQENYFLKRIVREQNANTVILTPEGAPVYCTKEQPEPAQLEMMRGHIPEVPLTGVLKFYHTERDILYYVTARLLRLRQQKYISFNCKASQISLRPARNGIRFFSEIEIAQLFGNSFYSLSGAMGALEHDVDSIALVRRPVMILGESGTGKEQIARALYLCSNRTKSPFTVIDCSSMNDKGRDFLFGHPNSPLNDDSGTVYFQHLDRLPDVYRQDLLAAMQESDAARRLRLIFSCTIEERQPLPDTLRSLIAQTGCMMLHLPPLRSRSDELPSLASLYLSTLNMELGKQIIGFDPQAIQLLLQYEWPNNYTQFKQVLYELATLTDSAYIRRSTVINTLSQQRRFYRRSAAHSGTGDYVPQTLEEITRQAISQTIEALDGNQTAAAKQLGISRTTLWRYLATDKEK